VRLIGPEGELIGVKKIDEARRIAQDQNLDLVLLSENTNPPVCKLVDYGQFMYQLKKKEKLAKKVVNIIKELKLSHKISSHDYGVRLDQALKFLQKKYKVKVSVVFRGREIVHMALGETLLKKFLSEIAEFGIPDSEISKAGKALIVIIRPK